MVSSFGKSFHVTGWKVGYLVAPEYLMKEIKKTSVSGFSVNSLCQVAISEYLDVVSVDGIGSMYQEKRLLQKAFRNKSVHCLVKVLIFKWLLTLQFLKMM
jgi:aspartate/methionine/tyrosine aminotransferase